MELCKYISILNEFDEIENFVLQDPTLKFTNPKSFNDLFECTVPFDGITQEEIKRIVDSIKKENKQINEEKLKELCNPNRISQNVRVCCLNIKKPSNSYDEVFWAHYGDNHKGICIVYDSAKLLSKFVMEKNITIDEITCDVFYSTVKYEGRERMKFENGKLTKGYTIENVLFQKNPCWKYENEFRIILTNNNFEQDNYFIKIDYDCIKEIIFGYRLGDKYKNQICDYYEGHGTKHIKFFSLEMDNSSDNLIKIPYKKSDFDYNKEFNYGRPMRREINTIVKVVPEICSDTKIYKEKLKNEYRFYSRKLLEDSNNIASYISNIYEIMIELSRINGISREDVLSKIENDFQKFGDYSEHKMIKEIIQLGDT